MFNRSKKEIPLENAILNSDLKQVKRHLEAGVDPNESVGGNNGYPLHYAAHSANVIQLLVDYGADVNVKDGKGRTPLHIAAVMAYEEALQILIENGADVNAVDNEGNTPLMLAQRGTPAGSFFSNLGVSMSEEEMSKRREIMDLLVANGAK